MINFFTSWHYKYRTTNAKGEPMIAKGYLSSIFGCKEFVNGEGSPKLKETQHVAEICEKQLLKTLEFVGEIDGNKIETTLLFYKRLEY